MPLLCRRLRRELQVLRVPRDVPVKAILLEAGTTNGVRLAGIDHEFRLAAEALETLIELLAAEDWDVHVGVAAHDQRGRDDLVQSEEGRDAHPRLRVLPRQPELRLPLTLIVI